MLLLGDDKPLAIEWTWDSGSRVLIVANGSFLLNEPLANRAFDTLAALDTVLGERCVYLAEHPEVVRGYTDFHWWPRASAISEAITPS